MNTALFSVPAGLCSEMVCNIGLTILTALSITFIFKSFLTSTCKTMRLRFFSWFKCTLMITVFLTCLWIIKQQQVYLRIGFLLARLGFPVEDTQIGRKFNTTFPVDIVYTWVNGSDPRLHDELERLKNKLRSNDSFSATNAKNLAPSRFADNGALRYSLRSLEKYANWIRHVFIVTNGQIPDWLNLRNPRVTIVEHKEIFDEPEYLPTFSSHAIEHNVHKIRGLSERFIYMNDDFFFGRNVSLEDFYTEDKGTKVYLDWNASTICGKKCKITMIKNGICDQVCNYDHCAWDGGDCNDLPVQKGPKDVDKLHCAFCIAVFYTNAIYSREFGLKKRNAISHSPLFMEKGVKQDLDKRFPNEVKETSHRKFRSPMDFQFEFSYIYFLMEAYNQSKRFETEVKSPNVAYILLNENQNKTRQDLNMLRRTKRKFICINDGINYTYSTEARNSIELVDDFYESTFPNPSSFEIEI